MTLGSEVDERIDHGGFPAEEFEQEARLAPGGVLNVLTPDRGEAALQAFVPKMGGYFAETGLQPPADEPHGVGEHFLIAGVVGELHGPAPIAGVTGGINKDGERSVQIRGDARFLGEILARGEGAHFALHLNRNPLPRAKMPYTALRRRGGGDLEKLL